jgi:ATP/maltotriose-dependent transcriptional regulator MalT
VRALAYYAQAEATATTEEDRRQAVWGRFLAMIGLEREEGAALALAELEAASDMSAESVLRTADGQLTLDTMRGEVGASLEHMRATAPLVEKATDPLVQSSALNAYAGTLALTGRYGDALTAAERELELADAYRLDFVKPHANVNRAMALWGLRHFKRSLRLLQDLQKTCRYERFVLMNVGTVLARIYLALGSPDRALRALEEHVGAETTPGMEAEFEGWWSLALACQGKADEAAERAAIASRMSRRTEVAGLVPWVAAVSASQSRAGTEQALEAFRRSRGTGNVDAFVSAYRACRDVLLAVATDNSTHRELRLILANANDQAFGSSIGLRVPMTESSQATLTKREGEVLALLVQGATNREIARSLFITETTAKVHLRHIYAKLGVRSRAEAIVRALEEDAGAVEPAAG